MLLFIHKQVSYCAFRNANSLNNKEIIICNSRGVWTFQLYQMLALAVLPICHTLSTVFFADWIFRYGSYNCFAEQCHKNAAQSSSELMFYYDSVKWRRKDTKRYYWTRLLQKQVDQHCNLKINWTKLKSTKWHIRNNVGMKCDKANYHKKNMEICCWVRWHLGVYGILSKC
jgi:hypothetical protein